MAPESTLMAPESTLLAPESTLLAPGSSRWLKKTWSLRDQEPSFLHVCPWIVERSYWSFVYDMFWVHIFVVIKDHTMQILCNCSCNVKSSFDFLFMNIRVHAGLLMPMKCWEIILIYCLWNVLSSYLCSIHRSYYIDINYSWNVKRTHIDPLFMEGSVHTDLFIAMKCW